MNFNPLLWFVCRFCKQAMPDLDRLKAHTLDNHMGECLEGVQIECIVFEESILDHECATASKANKNAHPKRNKFDLSANVNAKKPQNHIKNCTASPPPTISEQEVTPSKLGLSPSVALTRLSPKKLDPPKFETKTTTTKYVAGPKCYKAKKRKLSNSISSCVKENDDNKDSPAPKQNRLQPSDDKICEKLVPVISHEVIVIDDDDDDEPQEKPVPSSPEAEVLLDVNEECEAEATLELDDQSGLFIIRNPDGTVTEITNSPEPEPEAILISIPAVETFPGTTNHDMNFDIHEHADLLKINQVAGEPHQQAPFSSTISDCFSVLNDSVTVSIADSTAANFEFQLLLNNSNDIQMNECQGGTTNIAISTQNNDLAAPASDTVTGVLDVSEICTTEEQKQLQQLRQDVGMDFNFNTAGKNGKKIKKKFVAVLKKMNSNVNLNNSRREDKQVYAKQLEVVSVPSDSDASYTEISSTSTIVNSTNNYSNLSNSDSESISIPNNIHYEDTQELDNQQFFIQSANISQLSISNEMDVEIVADSEQDDPNSTPVLTPVPISVQFQFPSTHAFASSATNTITTSSTQDFDDFDDGMNLEQLKLKQQLQQQQQPQLVGYTSISDFIGCLGAPVEQHQEQQEEEPMKDSVSSSSVTIPTPNFDFELIHSTNSEVDRDNYLSPKNAIITCDSSDLTTDLIIERNTGIVHENRNKLDESTESVPPDTTGTNDNNKENEEEEGTSSLPLELQESSSLSPPPMIDLEKSIESQNHESINEDHQNNACSNTDDENTLKTTPSEIEDDEHQNQLQTIQSEIEEEPLAQNKLQTGENPDINRVEYRERSRSPVPVTQQTEDQTIFLMDNDFIDYACEEVVETSSSSAETTGESTVTDEIAMPSEMHPNFETSVDGAECGEEIQNEGEVSVETEKEKDTNEVTIVEADIAGEDVNVAALDNQLQNRTQVENNEFAETVNPDLPSPETTIAERGAEPEPEKTEEQLQQSQPELVDLPSASVNCEAPEVMVDTETNCEAPEVVDTLTNCEVPEVVDTETNCETPEVVVDTETNCETPEVVVGTETNCEVPEVEDAEISVTTSFPTTDVTCDDGNDTSEASFGMKNVVVDPTCSPCVEENLTVEPEPEAESENTVLPKNSTATSDNLVDKDDAYIENDKIPPVDPLSAYYSNISESESEIDECLEAISPTTTTATTTTTTTTVTTTEINVSIVDTKLNEDSNKNTTTTKLNGSLVFIPMDVPAPASTTESESVSVLPTKTLSLSRTLSHYDTWRKMSKNNSTLPTENTTSSANFLQHNPQIIKNRHFEDRLDEEPEVLIPSPTPVTVTTQDDVVMDSRKPFEGDQNEKELPHHQLPALPQKFRNHIRKKLMSGKKKKLKFIKKKLKKSACISVPKVRLVFDDKKAQSDNEDEKEVENDIGAENSLDVEEGESQAPISPPSPIPAPAPAPIPIAAAIKSNPKSLPKTDLVEEKKVEEDPISQVESSPIQSEVQKEKEVEQGSNISSPQPTSFKLRLKPSSAVDSDSASPKSLNSNKSGGKKKIAVDTRTISKSKLNSTVNKKLVSSKRHSHTTTHSRVKSQGKNDADDDIEIVFISDDKVTPKQSKPLSKYQDVTCYDDESSDGGDSDLDYKPTNHHAKTKTKLRSKTKPKIRNSKFRLNSQQKTKRQKLRKILKKPSVKTRTSIAAAAPSAVKSSVKSKLLSKNTNAKPTTSKSQLSMIQPKKCSQKEPAQSETKPTKKGTFLTPNSLVRWLALQKELSNSKSIKFPNVILLDPDPTLMPGNTPTKPRFEINRDKPVTCKLCSQKLISELQLQNHVENCWLHNKQRHRFCIICNRGFDNPVQLTQHNKSDHPDNSKVTKVTASPASARVTVPVSPISSSSSTRAKISLPILTPRPKRTDGDGSKDVDDRQIPKPRSNLELSLKQWLVKEAKINPSNIIALDPDPVSTSKTLMSISKSSPIKCKLCQVYLTSESRVKKHVALCWGSNKSKHLHCVSCDKTFAYTKGFQRHTMDKHFNAWKERRQAKKVVRRDWELEEEDPDPPLAKRVKITREKSAVESVPVAAVRAPARALGKDATVQTKPKPKLQPSPITTSAPAAGKTLKPILSSKQEKLTIPIVRLEPVKDIVRPVVCKICSMTFTAGFALTRHIEQVHTKDTKERLHKCPHCAATYKSLEDVRKHVGIHGKVTISDKLEPCSNQVNSKTTPENQRDRIHKGVTHALKCSVANCTVTCTSHSSLSNHLRLKHNIESLPQKQVQEQFVCPTFDLQDELTRSLKLKRRTLTSDKDNNNCKPYKCTHNNCAMGFRTKIQLDKHVKDEHRKVGTTPSPIASTSSSTSTSTSRKRELSQAGADGHVPVPVPVSSARTPNSVPTLNRPTPKVRCLSPDICDF